MVTTGKHAKCFQILLLICVALCLSACTFSFPKRSQLSDADWEKFFAEVPVQIPGDSHANAIPVQGGIFQADFRREEEDGIYYVADTGERVLLLAGAFYNLQLQNDCLYAVNTGKSWKDHAYLYKIDFGEHIVSRFRSPAQFYCVFSDDMLLFMDAKTDALFLTDWEMKRKESVLPDAQSLGMLQDGDRVVIASRSANCIYTYTREQGLLFIRSFDREIDQCFLREDRIYVVLRNEDWSRQLFCYTFAGELCAEPTDVPKQYRDSKHWADSYLLTETEAAKLEELNDIYIRTDLQNGYCIADVKEENQVYLYEDRICIENQFGSFAWHSLEQLTVGTDRRENELRKKIAK